MFFKDRTVKIQTEKIIKVPYCIKDTIPIYRISEGGIFELENPDKESSGWWFLRKKKRNPLHQFDKMYLFEDINFSMQDEEGKESTCKKFEVLLRSLNVSYKIIVSNHYADNHKLKESILLKAVSDDRKPLAREYHRIMEDRLRNGRSGLLQSKYFIISCRKEDYESAKTYFNTVEFSIEQLFRKLGSGLIPLNATERLRALHSFYRMGDEESFSFDWDEYLRLRRDWRNDIINTSLKEYPEYLEFDSGKYGCTLFVRKFANGLTDKYLSEITSLNFPLIYTMDCEPIDNNYAYRMVMKKYMSNELSIFKEQQNKNDNGDYATNINYERRKQQRDAEEMLDRLSSFDERLLFVGMTILIKADSLEELKVRIEKIKNIGQMHNMDIVSHSSRQLDAMNTTLPTGARFVDTMRSITSDELSIFIPFDVQEINDMEGFCYGFNQVSKNLILGNRKLLKNGNGLVFGLSGAGKSFQEKMEMGQVLCFTNDDIIIVDPMNEYKDICKAWGGEYVNLSQSRDNKFFINPFHVPDYVGDRDKFIAEKAEFGFAIVEQALKDTTPCTSRHTAIIDKAVRGVYRDYFSKVKKMHGRQRKRIPSPTIKSIRQWIIDNEIDDGFNLNNQDDYEDLGNKRRFESRAVKDAAIEIVNELEAFADGTMSIFSNQQTEGKHNRLIVYGFSDLGEKLRHMAMIIMIETITSQIKYNQEGGVTTWVYLDELHELWKDEYSLRAVERMWREVRKRGGICTGMSQNLIDTKEHIATQTMVSNSEFTLLLDQGKMDKDDVSSLFQLSSEQLSCVNDVDRGTGLIRFGDKIISFDNTVSKDSELYKLFNTDFHEIQGSK